MKIIYVTGFFKRMSVLNKIENRKHRGRFVTSILPSKDGKVANGGQAYQTSPIRKFVAEGSGFHYGH